MDRRYFAADFAFTIADLRAQREGRPPKRRDQTNHAAHFGGFVVGTLFFAAIVRPIKLRSAPHLAIERDYRRWCVRLPLHVSWYSLSLSLSLSLSFFCVSQSRLSSSACRPCLAHRSLLLLSLALVVCLSLCPGAGI